MNDGKEQTDGAKDEPSKPAGLALPEQTLPDVIHLIPVTSRPFFPAQVQPVMVDAEPWKDTLQAVADGGGQPVVGLIYVPDFDDQAPLDEFPLVTAWRQRIKERPAVQRGVALGKEDRRAQPPTEEERKILFQQK